MQNIKTSTCSKYNKKCFAALSLSLLLWSGSLTAANTNDKTTTAGPSAETSINNLPQAAIPVVSKEVASSINKVKPSDVKAHIQYLADDKLQGRLPGTPGYQMAVDYVIKQYKSMGVEPAGENNTYLQKVRLRRSYAGKEATLMTRNPQGSQVELAYGKDFILYPNPEQPEVAVEAPLVFAGYGISAPELGYDDYAGIDAKGKIVVVLRGAPEKFHSTVSAYSADVMTILKNAAAHGAVGVILGSTNTRVNLTPFERGIVSVMNENGKVAASRSYVSDQIKVLGMLHATTFTQLLHNAGLDAQQVANTIKGGTTASAPLNVTISSRYTSTYEDFESYNVVGKITGSDARLRNEYVVHSAHLDHLGVGRPVDGDSIYNGAHDNASGVSSLLEIARVYSRIKQKPKRSILIVMVTGEEMGLLGSAYFANNPTVPKENIVANVNTDMPTIIAPLLAVVPLGAEHSSLKEKVNAAASYFKLAVEADPEPEQNRFIRSDQYSFVMNGIPALHIKYGNKTADGANNLHETVKVWREKYYHKPQDDINGVFDFEAGKRYVQLNFLIGYLVAQDENRPTWNGGDFFGERFGM
jgi:Zn-dependent M28 family amino/carboxypeptidase